MKISYPVLLITDVHTNLFNLRRLLLQYPKHTVVCLGDIVNLWDKNTTNSNQEIVDFFIQKKIICIKGNHDEHVGANLPTYGITNEMANYLNNLPRSITLELPDNKRYDCYHYRPNDYWSLNHPNSMTYDQFCAVYGDSINSDAILIGHLHMAYELTYQPYKGKLIGIGALKEDQYAILTENGIEHKKL